MLQRLLNYIKRWWETPVVGGRRKLALEGAVPEHEAGVESGTGAMQDVQAVAERVGDAAGMVMPYDEHLLERARTQWQFGDWDCLSQISIESLKYHPDRAKVGLLVVAAKLQTGHLEEAKRAIRMVQEWGIATQVLSRVLISGVHNSIGRAAMASGHPLRALEHFERSLSVGQPGSDAKLLSSARVGKQLEQLGLSELHAQPQNGDRAFALALSPAGVESTVGSSVISRAETIDAQLERHGHAIDDLRQHLDSKLKTELGNAIQQIEAFLDIQNFFSTGSQLPMMHGWPISPDFARYLVNLLRQHRYDLIIEFGSGTSTLLIAKALATLRANCADHGSAVQLAFEHLERYFDETSKLLESEGLLPSVRLLLSPLEPYRAPNGNVYPYYRCAEILQALSSEQTKPDIQILMVVDGPPSSTGRHARFPCLPLVLSSFPSASIHLLLDDYIRTDEKEVGALWLQELKAAGYSVSSHSIRMEKDALLIKAQPRKNLDSI